MFIYNENDKISELYFRTGNEPRFAWWHKTEMNESMKNSEQWWANDEVAQRVWHQQLPVTVESSKVSGLPTLLDVEYNF